MIDTTDFLNCLLENNIGRLAGVPCSFLGPLINRAEQQRIYDPFVNEGDAVAYAAGTALCGKRCAVLMQNSGLSNALSPLTSLNELFGLHVLLIIGNRGMDDEPQHRIMAGAVKPFLDSLQIPFFNVEDAGAIEKAFAALPSHSAALLVNRRDTFSKVELERTYDNALPMRYDILNAICACAGDSIIVTATGFTSREMYCIRDRKENFYMVGSMGCLSSLAMGIAESLPQKKVIAIDGDSACLMRLGALYTLTQHKPENLFYIVLDNDGNESTGGQPNCRGNSRLLQTMSALYETLQAGTPDEVGRIITEFMRTGRYTQVYIKTRPGTRGDLSRPQRQLIFGQAERFYENIGRMRTPL